MLSPRDLDSTEIALLGVLMLGLPPSMAARDATFRVDYVTSVTVSLAETGARSAYLDDGGRVTTSFRERLRSAVARLTALEVLAEQPGDMPAAPGGFEAGLAIDLVDPDTHPAVMDRALAQECMEALLNIPAVYPYLMERYAKAGEVWRDLREQGYAQ